MFKSLVFSYLLFITLIQSQSFTVEYPTFPADTDIGSCACDLTVGRCDPSCCCDSDCNSADKLAFACNLRDNQYTNSTPILSTVQPTCFKNISIFKSNSPYIIQKMGELVCVDSQRYTGSGYYQQPTSETLNANTFLQTIDSIYGVLPSYLTPSGQTNYLVGTPIFKNDSTFFSLPISLFGSDLCSGSQTITYMNNFQSTCNQIVSSTCTGALNPLTYLNPLCLLQSPGSANPVCANVTGISGSSGTSPCTGALQSLTVNIYYSNPTGIVSVNFTPPVLIDTSNLTLQQTFTVQFIKIQSSVSLGSPGYRQGASITVGNVNNSTINLNTSSPFSIPKPDASGFCNSSGDNVPVGFGENVRSTCRYNVIGSSCPNPFNLFSNINVTTLRVAAYANSSTSNSSTDWLPVRICKSNINTPTEETCDDSDIIPSIPSYCYTSLHIQIAYTNIGSIKNPQSVLSAVIFHYQYDTSVTSGTILLTKSITFQEIPNTPIVEQGQIPTPNTRLPANFFYPFSGSLATKSMTFSFSFYLFLGISPSLVL